MFQTQTSPTVHNSNGTDSPNLKLQKVSPTLVAKCSVTVANRISQDITEGAHMGNFMHTLSRSHGFLRKVLSVRFLFERQKYKFQERPN